jgi:hypothetical protein
MPGLTMPRPRPGLVSIGANAMLVSSPHCTARIMEAML